METIRRDAHHLLHRVHDVCTRPPVGVCPWKGREILALVKRADEYSPDHGAFYMTFMDGVRDLVEGAEEDRLLQRFTRHTLAAEARVHADARAAALARLAAAGVPAAPCLDFDEVFVEPYLLAAGAITTQEHPMFGTLELAGPFMHFAATPIAYRRSAPLLGADAAAVLAELGYPEARIAELVAAGVVGTP